VSDPMNPVPPAARARPSTVTISSALLVLVGVLELTSAAIGFSVMGKMADALNRIYAGTELEGSGDFLAGLLVAGGAVFGLVLGIGLAILAIFNNKGKNPSRITTWAVGGLLLCCSGFGVISSISGASLNFGNGGAGGADLPDQQEVNKAVQDALPSWYTPVSVTVAVLVVLALMGALILLALPPSNEYFRKPVAAWQPPAPTYPTSFPPAAPPPPAPGQGPPQGQEPGHNQPPPGPPPVAG
jgi:hypothetical protein